MTYGEFAERINIDNAPGKLKVSLFNNAKITVNEFNSHKFTVDIFNYWLP